MPEKESPVWLTLADVAKKAGVSRSLASLALRGEAGVASGTRKHILKIAADLNYRPNPIARNLASRASSTLGVVVGRIDSPFAALLVQALDTIARRSGYDVLLAINAHPADAARPVVERLRSHRVAGMILIGTALNTTDLRSLARELPIVYVGKQLPSLEIDTVGTDDFLGATMAVEHLVALGHRQILHIDGGRGDGAASRRLGYTEAMTNAGLESRIVSAEYSIDAGATAMNEILGTKNLPTAVFAASDTIAIGALNTLLRFGMKVPEQIAVVGYDDIPLASTEMVSLTTIRQLADRIAEQNVATLLRRIADPTLPAQKQLISPELVVRRSSGASPPAGAL